MRFIARSGKWPPHLSRRFGSLKMIATSDAERQFLAAVYNAMVFGGSVTVVPRSTHRPAVSFAMRDYKERQEWSVGGEVQR